MTDHDSELAELAARISALDLEVRLRDNRRREQSLDSESLVHYKRTILRGCDKNFAMHKDAAESTIAAMEHGKRRSDTRGLMLERILKHLESIHQLIRESSSDL